VLARDSRFSRALMWTTVIALTVAVLGGAAWIASTWGDPHRGGLVGLAIGVGATTTLVALLLRDRVLEASWSEPFFAGWTLMLIAVIAVGAALDDGIHSPLALCLFGCTVYPALSYPRWAVALDIGAALAALVTLTLVPGDGVAPPTAVYVGALIYNLVLAAVLCRLQGRFQESTMAQLRRISRIDPLTGALNRLGFQERLEAELERVRAGGVPAVFVLLDLDGFKQVNDTHGHAAGDKLLCCVVRAMDAVIGPDDSLARIGGDEFAVILARSDRGAANLVAERLRNAIADWIGVSVGVAMISANDEAEQVHRRADELLYADKRSRQGERRAGEPARLTAASMMARPL
jgi:diguanylate cyclase (GGDEF)-like protein